jgi:hypothetical protein
MPRDGFSDPRKKTQLPGEEVLRAGSGVSGGERRTSIVPRGLRRHGAVDDIRGDRRNLRCEDGDLVGAVHAGDRG